MPTRTNKRTGEVQELRDGQWVTIKPAMSLPGMTVQTKPADPTLPGRVTKTNNEAAASGYDPAKAAADLRIKQLEAQIKTIEASSAGAQTQAELQKAQLDVEKARAEIGALKSGKGGAIKALQEQVDRVGELYRKELKGGLPNKINDLIPDTLQPDKGAFDTAGQGLTNPFMAAFRVPGVGAQSDTELRQFLAANTPAQGDSDAVIEEKLRNIQTRIDAEQGVSRSEGLPPITGGDAPQVEMAGGSSRSEIDPALRAIGARVGQMLAGNASDRDILEYLKDSGVDPALTNVGQALQHRKTDGFKVWQRANPGKPYPIGPEFYTREVPMTSARAIVNSVADSAPGAFAVGAANALTGGRLDNMSDNPELARAGLDMVRANSPLASFAGDLAGAGMMEATLGRIPGARGLLANRWGRRGADALYGAYSGSGEMDSVEGGLMGAGIGALGGGLGRRLQAGVGGMMTGVTNPNLQYLNNRNVPLTLGQIGRGSESVIGRAVGGIEERALGLPGLDAVIGAARKRGDEGFNRAAFAEAFDTLGKPFPGNTGAAGVNDLQSARKGAYSFLDNTTLTLDAPYAGTNAGIRASIPSLPDYGPQIGRSMDTIDKAASGGSLPGRAWQDAVRLTRGDRASLAGKEFSSKAVDVLGQIEQNLMGLAARQAPPGTANDLSRANAFNAQAETLLKALDNGPAQKADELFSAGRLDDASRQNANKFGGRWNSLGGKRPFYDLTTAGKNVMPNLTPDSGSIGRLAFIPVAGAALGGIGGALGSENPIQSGAEGGGSGLGTGIAATAVLSALYSKGGQKAIQKAMLGPRSPGVARAGQALKNRKRIASAIGAALLRDYFTQDELGQ